MRKSFTLPLSHQSITKLIAMLFTTALGFASLYIAPVSAQTRYVTDSLEVMMRTGPSTRNKILKILKSGERLEILQQDAGGDYSQIRTSKGDEGYVLTRYLTNTPSARNRVISLEAQLQQLKAKPGELQALLATAQEDNQALIAQNTDLTANLKKTSGELANIKRVSSDAVNIANRNTKLEGEVQELLLQLDDIRIQNKSLRDQSAQRWFLLGGGAILFGLFLGWLLSISKSRRRQSWGA